MQANSSELNTPPQVNSSLAERLRWVLKSFGLQQGELAAAMGVNVDRVKSLVLGRAQHLRHDELLGLRNAYGLEAEWLQTGRPPHVTGSYESPALERAVGDADRLVQGFAGQPFGGSTDVGLLQDVIRCTAKELDARGLTLSSQARLRLYWAVFESSLPSGAVNVNAIGPMLALAMLAEPKANK